MDGTKKLHVAMFPWLAFGHIIPYLELAKLIVQRGHKISFISTPRNIQRLPKIPPDLAPHINLVSLPLPSVEGLPNNAEATTDIPTQKIQYLKKAFDGLQGPLLHFLQTCAPDWIIYDFAPYWLLPIVEKLRIKGAFFSIFAAWSTTFIEPPLNSGDDPRSQPEDFTVPPKWIPFPSKVAFLRHEAKQFASHYYEVNDSGFSDQFRVRSIVAGCDVIAIRSCYEVEPDFLKLFGQLHGKPVLPIGLLPPLALDSSSSGDEDDTWLRISEWLDNQNKGSVVYIAFGSEVEVSQSSINEIALGLELSELPFFWTLRKQADKSIELPDGFEQRVKGRGLMWTSWVPQLRILNHDSIGGFLTHCGYSSIIEALHFGRALIMLPISIDQGLIARVFGEKKVGVEIPRNEDDGSFTRDSVAESLRLVIVSTEGKEFRDNAKEMKKLFSNKDLQDRYLDYFVEYLQNHGVACKD